MTRSSRRSNHPPKGNEKSHAEEILQRLKQRPAIRENLIAISPKYTGRISDLRAKGHDIVEEHGIYLSSWGWRQDMVGG